MNGERIENLINNDQPASLMLYEWDDNSNLICRCGKSMIMKFAYEQKEDTPNYSYEDEWVCEGCDFTLPSRRYSDWFGSGDTHEEVAHYLEKNADGEQPLRILYSGFMVCIIYAEDVVIFGYDGNEYTHSFHFTNEEPHIQPFLAQVLRLDRLSLKDE